MKPLIEELNKRFLQFAQYQERLSVDESMVPYFGRHSSKESLLGMGSKCGVFVNH